MLTLFRIGRKKAPKKLHMQDPQVRISFIGPDNQQVATVEIRNPLRAPYCLADILSIPGISWNEEQGLYRLEYWDISCNPAIRRQLYFTDQNPPEVASILKEFSVF